MDVASVVVGIIGVCLAIYFYLRTQKVKRLAFDIRSFSLIHRSVSALPDLTINYRNRPVYNLSAVKMLLQNTGNEVLNWNDIAEKDSLIICLDDREAAILSGRRLFTSNEANNVAFLPNGARADEQVTFDYLAPGDACVISFLHTGREPAGVYITGTVKGGTLAPLFTPKWLSWLSAGVALLTAVTCVMVGVTLGELVGSDETMLTTLSKHKWMGYVLVMFLLVLIGAAALDRFQKRSIRVPGPFAERFRPDQFQ